MQPTALGGDDEREAPLSSKARIALAACITIVATGAAAVAAEARVAAPPMGWNSWYQYGKAIDEELIRGQADAMVASGMRDAGYEYLIVDGGWRAKTRDAGGDMQADPAKFPSGMKPLADYVHSKGLKFGLHQPVDEDDCGNETPGTGSAPDATFPEKARRDATLFASWGVDFLKFDWCGEPEGRPAGMSLREWKEFTYGAMGDALEATGRDIVYSISEYGTDEPWEWAPGIADMWRTTVDIKTCWACPRRGITPIIDRNADLFAYPGPGRGFNDPDQLQVGIDSRLEGQQPVPQEPLPLAEQRSHFSIWAMLAAPLIAGLDMRDMTPEMGDILMNREVVAIDQDRLGVQARRIRDSGDEEVWTRPLADGSVAVALFNRAEAGATMSIDAAELGLRRAFAYVVRDVWAHRTTAAAETVSAYVPSHGTALLRVRPGWPWEAEPATVVSLAGADDLVAGEPGEVTTTVTNLGRIAVRDVTQSLDVPPGWEIEPSGGTKPARWLAPRESASVTWRVVARAHADAGERQDLTAAARYRLGWRRMSARTRTDVLVDPFAAYVPQEQMTATASSVLGPGSEAGKAIDGDPWTWWHSARVDAEPLPATLTLDLGAARTVKGLTYLPRPDEDNGHVKRFAVHLSDDGSNFTRVVEGEWPEDMDLNAVAWPAATARYVRLEVLDGASGLASAAEVNVATG
jgi:alpha-galactosidase